MGTRAPEGEEVIRGTASLGTRLSFLKPSVRLLLIVYCPVDNRVIIVVMEMIANNPTAISELLNNAESEFCAVISPLDLSGLLRYGTIHITVQRGRVEVIKIEKTIKPTRTN